MRLVTAIDVYIGELARRNRKPTTRRTYQRLLFDFADQVDPHHERTVDTITPADCRKYLDRWQDAEPSTLATGVSLLRGFFDFLEQEGELDRTPMANIKRPRRKRPEDLRVVTTAGDQVTRMIFACQDAQELICLGAACYLGRRRTALANARRHDADLERGLVRFTDKGGKVIVQPIPNEFLAVLREAEQWGVWDGPDDYLIPNRRKLTTNPTQRSSKIIYETVQRVAKRAGVKTHVHALRAAFAVHFLEQNPGHIESLKELMGHDRIETTMVYLRRMNRAKAMEDVRDLTWTNLANSELSGFSPRAVEAHTGFEPVLQETPPPDPLSAKLKELREVQRQKQREDERGRRR